MIKKMLLFILICINFSLYANTSSVGHWRWCKDDASGTWLGDEDAEITITTNDNIRIRMEIYDNDPQGYTDHTKQISLGYFINGANRYIISDDNTKHFIMSDTPFWENNSETSSDLLSATNSLPSGSGLRFDAAPTFLINCYDNKRFEVEFCIKPTSNIVPGEKYYFYLDWQGTILGSLNPILMVSDALPVELATFSGKMSKENIELLWETATEKNNYGFEVERNTASNNEENSWEKIGFVAGNGNSNSVKSYSFTDPSPREGKSIYRLKQIDLDGKYEYSKEIEVEYRGAKGFALEQNYPNPFNPTTKISYNMAKRGNVTIKIFNSIGEEVRELVNMTKEAGNYSVEFNAGDLPSGTYFCVMNTAGYRKTNKLLLIK